MTEQNWSTQALECSTALQIDKSIQVPPLAGGNMAANAIDGSRHLLIWIQTCHLLPGCTYD